MPDVIHLNIDFCLLMHKFYLLSLKYLLLLAIASLASYSFPIQAQVVTQQNQLLERPKLPDNGAPLGRRRGGTSRNDCPPVKIPVTALVPGKETVDDFQASTSFLATTISEYPTFWVYVPQLPQNTRSGEFILQNASGENMYKKLFTIPSTAAFISIKLPHQPEYNLKIGQKYHWYFKIYCGNPEAETGYFYVDAWIERVALTKEIEREFTISKLPKYFTYFGQNIWYDALTDLGEHLIINSQNTKLKTDWIKFLKSIDLSDIAQENIVILTINH